MNNIKEQSKNPVAVGIAAAILGLLVGLLVAWVIWPVQWYDAGPDNLQVGWQDWWLRMTIDSYTQNLDAQLANQRYQALGEFAPQTLANITANPGSQNLEAINAFGIVVNAGQLPPAAESGALVTEATQVVEAPEAVVPEEEGKGPSIWVILGALCLVVLIVGGALVVFFILQNRKARGEGAVEGGAAIPKAEYTDFAAMGKEPPLSQYMASYHIGDDLFDDSFSIDSPNGEFLGECGVGISETIGVGDPKKVTAFEVWLFDKNDIQTVTKVLMSQHAYEDSSIRSRLEAKGDALQVEANAVAVLETATLRLEARIVDTAYGEGALPDKSYFDGLTLEIAVWQK